jgi:hypothetical protein
MKRASRSFEGEVTLGLGPPDALVAAVARAAAITDPSRLAAMLARLPRVPLLRAQLRRLAASIEPRQVPLL